MHVQISVDKETVSFGSVCVGEVCKRTVAITNSGALPTTYHLLPAPLSPLRVSHTVGVAHYHSIPPLK